MQRLSDRESETSCDDVVNEGFQTNIRVFSNAHKTQKRALGILRAIGLVPSHTQVSAVLRGLASSTRAQLLSMAQNPIKFCIDNVDQKVGVRHTSVYYKSYLDNSTAGYASKLLLGDVEIPQGLRGIPMAWWKLGQRVQL